MKLLIFLALVALFLSSVVTAQNPVVKQVPVRSTRTLQGSDLYMEYCAVCHGRDGRGGGPAAAAMKQQPADLTQLARKNGGKFDELRVQSVITGEDVVAAHGSRDMPTWGSVFASMTPSEGMRKLRVNSLVRHVESLQAK